MLDTQIWGGVAATPGGFGFLAKEVVVSPARLVILACAVVVALGQPLAGVAGDDPQPVDNSHNVLSAPAPVTDGVFGTSPPVKTGTAICTTTRQTGANANTDCAEPSKGPHNETSIAVNPTNPLNMLGGANDYQLALNPGGQVSETVLSRAHVTFDGGQTWSMYPVNSSSTYQATGDPAVAFDASGHAYYATLGFRFVGPTNAQNPDVLVSNSRDGGKTWTTVRVASGSGVFSSEGDLLDKEYIAADPTNGAYLVVVWSDMRNSTTPAPSNPYVAHTNSDVIVSQSFDNDHTWSAATALTLSGDQFMPWGAYDQSGRLRIGTFDRSGDSANHKYNYALASETVAGTLAFTTAPISDVQSDPTTGNRWFARNVNPAFPRATAFIGDYSGIAIMPDGSGVVALWTDLRNDAKFAGITRKGQDAYFAKVS